MKQRIVFINLHGNEFLVKTINKIIFGQSAAVKHKYLLNYLLENDEYEVCTFINKRGLSLSYTTQNPLLQSLRFLEHKYIMRRNGINSKKIRVLKKEDEIKPTDIIISYSYYAPSQLVFNKVPDAFRVICQIHFGTYNSEIERKFEPHLMYNEADLRKHSGMWRRDLPWFNGEFLTIPFVPQDRFKSIKPFGERKNKAVSVGTITYMKHIEDYYGDSCAQPSRRLCRDLGRERPDIIDSFNFDYLEEQNNQKPKYNNRILARLHAKFTGGHQKKYFSFDMVEKFNDYKIAVVGEEIMGIPGIGFVEAMACGCALIGQNKGYYEDYGMKEGIHYIGYDGTKEDLVNKLEYWTKEENQEALERIAENGYRFVKENFQSDKIAGSLFAKMKESQKTI